MSEKTHDGGKVDPDLEKYSPPKGPINMQYEKPGLRGGVNHGNRGTQGSH